MTGWTARPGKIEEEGGLPTYLTFNTYKDNQSLTSSSHPIDEHEADLHSL